MISPDVAARGCATFGSGCSDGALSRRAGAGGEASVTAATAAGIPRIVSRWLRSPLVGAAAGGGVSSRG